MKTDASQSMVSEVGIWFGSCRVFPIQCESVDGLLKYTCLICWLRKTESCHCVSGSAGTHSSLCVHFVFLKLKLALQGKEIWYYHYGSRTVNSVHFF